MPSPAERARRLVERVSRRERRNTRELLERLERLRRQLVAPLADASEFDIRMRQELLADAERVVAELEATVHDALLEQVEAVARDSVESRLSLAATQLGDEAVQLAGISTDAIDLAGQYDPALVRRVGAATRSEIRNVILSAELGEASGPDVARRLGAVLSREGRPTGVFGRLATQVERIARTEVQTVHELATKAADDRVVSRSTREAFKTWVTSRDTRVRSSHRHLSGVRIRYDERFNVGAGREWSKVSYEEAQRRGGVLGEPAEHPKDVSLSARQRINCRCTRALSFGRIQVEALLDLVG